MPQDEHLEQTDAESQDGVVDSSASADEGQTASFVQKDGSAGQQKDGASEKKGRISQTEWQNMKTEVKKSRERDEKILKALGIEPKEGEEVDAVAALTQKISDLESSAIRKDFEAEVPVVRTEKYAKPWKDICEAKKHLVQSGELTYEDLWKMIRDEGEYQADTKAVQETQKQEEEQFSGSIPFFGNSLGGITSEKLSPADQAIAKGMGWTEENYKAAGVKL